MRARRDQHDPGQLRVPLRSRVRVLVRAGALVLAGALGLVAGCPFELERGVSCGDGWWDPEFEECDPRDPEASYLNHCRDLGIDMDAECDPQTCTIRPCAPVCGDGVVLGDEECEATADALGGFKSPDCTDYLGPANGPQKPYAFGAIGGCTTDCKFGRNGCNFCGDGVVDSQYKDWIEPYGLGDFPKEVCDGNSIRKEDLEAHCEDQKVCGVSGLNGDVVVLCEFECKSDCSGVVVAGDIGPGPNAESLKCCLDAGSPCPLGLDDGVPDLPCCTWLDDPAYYDPDFEWVAQDHCSEKDSSQDPPFYICSN